MILLYSDPYKCPHHPQPKCYHKCSDISYKRIQKKMKMVIEISFTLFNYQLISTVYFSNCIATLPSIYVLISIYIPTAWSQRSCCKHPAKWWRFGECPLHLDMTNSSLIMIVFNEIVLSPFTPSHISTRILNEGAVTHALTITIEESDHQKDKVRKMNSTLFHA